MPITVQSTESTSVNTRNVLALVELTFKWGVECRDVDSKQANQ